MTLLGRILDESLFKPHCLELGNFESLEVLPEGGSEPLGTVCLETAQAQ